MSAIEWAILIGFGVPIVVLSGAFIALACMMQAASERRDAHDEY